MKITCVFIVQFLEQMRDYQLSSLSAALQEIIGDKAGALKPQVERRVIWIVKLV